MPLRSLVASIDLRDNASAALRSVDSSIDGVRDNLQGVDNDLGAVSIATDSFGNTASSVFQAAKLKVSELGDKIAGLEKPLKAAGEKMTAVGKKMSLGVTAPIVAAGGAALLAAKTTEEAYHILARSTGTMGEELEAFHESFRTVFTRVPESADVVASAMGNLNTQLGLTGIELETLTQRTLELARINGIDAATAADELGKVINALGVDLADASSLMDKFAYAAQNSNIDIFELADSLIQSQGAFKALGYDLDQSIALFAQLNMVGAKPRQVIGGLNAAMMKLSAQGAENAEVALQELIVEIRDMEDSAAAGALAAEMFGARVGRNLAEQIRSGTFETGEWVEALRNADGTIEGLAVQTMSFSDRLKVFKNEATMALEPFGIALMDAMTSAFDAMRPVLDALAGLAKRFAALDDGTKRIIIIFAALVAAIGPVLVVVGQVTSGVGSLIGAIGKIGPVLKGAGGAFQAFSTVLLANPIALVIAAIVALVAAIWLIWDNWDEVSKLLEGAWNWLKDTATNIFGGIADAIMGALEWVKDMVVNAAMFVVDAFLQYTPLGIIISQWDEIASFFTNIAGRAIEWGSNIISGLVDGIKAGIQWVKDAIGNIGSTIVNGIKGFFGIKSPSTLMADLGSSIISGLVQGLKNALGSIKDIVGTVFQYGKDIANGLANGISNAAGNALNAVKNTASSIVGGIKDFFGIRSPSTLMMEYGVNIGEGLNLGFEKEMERPTILNQLENIYTPAAAPVASSSSMTFAPVVYIDVQGGDQDIADEIDRQLRRTFDTYARAFMERNARRV